jgi:hypothetical protein
MGVSPILEKVKFIYNKIVEYLYIVQMNNVYDLQKSSQFQIRASYDLLITLLDELFGKDSDKDTIRIDLASETEKNHQFVRNQWEAIHSLYKTPNNIKKTQKLVRQTLKQVVTCLNETYQFVQPIKLEQKRHDSYQKGKGIVTQRWIELTLIWGKPPSTPVVSLQ